jgi:hypothetical protein
VKSARDSVLCTLGALVLCGCASTEPFNPALVRAPMIPAAVPMPIRTLEVYDPAQGKRVNKDVLSLKAAEIRGRLTSTATFITVEKRDSSGKLTYLGAGGEVSGGEYRVTFDYTNFTNQDITFTNSETPAIGRIGVGLRIVAELQTSGRKVDLGGLIPLGIAAQDNKVRGHLQFLVYGMSNDKVALAAPSQAILSVDAIQKAFEAAAAVRVLFGLDDTKLEPYLIGVSDVRPELAAQALNAATAELANMKSNGS